MTRYCKELNSFMEKGSDDGIRYQHVNFTHPTVSRMLFILQRAVTFHYKLKYLKNQ